MASISKTRLRLLNFIRTFLQERGYAPTVRDIAKGCNISTSSVVQHHLNMLERQGYIQRDPQVFRSIRLTHKGQPVATHTIPLLGTISAGEPIPVPTSDTWATIPDETVRLPDELVRSRESIYALKVKGTSMIDALIDDGDIVLMQQTSTVDDGDMAAVWLKAQQEVTLKKIYREGKRIRLQPANREMKLSYQNADNVEIQGRVVGVIRIMGS
ncbi:transcriptional repressor LexA [Chloroflexota bacterium]